MMPTNETHNADQSLWLDNITRSMLDDGTLQRYIDDLSITGLTSNPTIFEHAISNSDAYDADIRAAVNDTDTEALFIQMALADLARAADLFRQFYDRSIGTDGWVSMEVSPLLANDPDGTVDAVKKLHGQAGRENMFIKIPGTKAGLYAIEEATFTGIPVNVTLLFSADQYRAAARAWMRGLERRLQAGLDCNVHSVASLFVSRWDVAVNDKVDAGLRNRLGIAVAAQAWRTYLDLQKSEPWLTLAAAGAPMQRLLWASTGTKDPEAPDVLYAEALALPGTINTLPDKTLKAFVDHGAADRAIPEDGGDCDAVIASFGSKGVNISYLAQQLQDEGAKAFVKSWRQLMKNIDDKRQKMTGASGGTTTT